MNEIHKLIAELERWVNHDLLSWVNLTQAGAIGLCFVVAWLASIPLRKKHEMIYFKRQGPLVAGTIPNIVNRMIPQIICLALLGLSYYTAVQMHWPRTVLRIGFSLLLAWIVIRMVATLVRNPPLARMLALMAWTIAALNIVNLLGPTIKLLDSIAINVGKTHLSLFLVIKGVVYLAVALWAANLLSRFIDSRLHQSNVLTPSIRVLTGKLIRFALIVSAFLVAVSTVGIDLTIFAVFSGALGVGLGFGLQKVVSNFISGIILLLDKSIKPGDVISVGETYGWVKSLNARYVSLDTRDGIEHLIPNEDLIVQRVENWSYSNNRVRLRVPVGVHYNSDVHQAMALCIEAVGEVDRLLQNPEPVCLLSGFGDSSVDLEVRAWIEDPQAGISNVKSEVLLRIWDKFHEHGIEIPFPQRDLHIKTPIEIRNSPPE